MGLKYFWRSDRSCYSEESRVCLCDSAIYYDRETAIVEMEDAAKCSAWSEKSCTQPAHAGEFCIVILHIMRMPLQTFQKYTAILRA